MFSCAGTRTLRGRTRVCSIFVSHQPLPSRRPSPGLVYSSGEQLHQRLFSLRAVLSGPSAIYRMHRCVGAVTGEQQLCGMYSYRYHSPLRFIRRRNKGDDSSCLISISLQKIQSKDHHCRASLIKHQCSICWDTLQGIFGFRDQPSTGDRCQFSNSQGEKDNGILTRLCFVFLASRAQKRHRHAIIYFKESLELNPFLWEAFENLCELGMEVSRWL